MNDKVTQIEKKEKIGKYLTFVGSLFKHPQWPGLGQTDNGQGLCISHVGALAQHLNNPLPFQAHQLETGLQWKQLGLK